LAKCFRVGMQKSLILSEAEKEARRQIIEQNRQNKVEKALQVASLHLVYMIQNMYRGGVDIRMIT